MVAGLLLLEGLVVGRTYEQLLHNVKGLKVILVDLVLDVPLGDVGIWAGHVLLNELVENALSHLVLLGALWHGLHVFQGPSYVTVVAIAGFDGSGVLLGLS